MGVRGECSVGVLGECSVGVRGECSVGVRGLMPSAAQRAHAMWSVGELWG